MKAQYEYQGQVYTLVATKLYHGREWIRLERNGVETDWISGSDVLEVLV